MATEQIQRYYSETLNRKTRDDLVFSVGLIEDEKIAIDCGCGAGSDIEYLRDNGFTVHAFDIEEHSIRICRERFKNDPKVRLSQDSFSSFTYPKANLILAEASLFFCPEVEFESVWKKIISALTPGGVFCGSFLGPDDTMAGPDYDREAYWPEVLVFNEPELRSIFSELNILKFTEHNVDGKTSDGKPIHWHIYSVVAQKI